MWCGTTLVIVYLISLQCWLYRKTINETIHPFYQVCMITIVVITFYNGFLVYLGRLDWYVVAPPGSSGADAFSFMHFLGYSKTFISCIKYIPAIALNFRLKNTAGFSIIQVLFDIGGAATSFTQSMLNAYITPNPDGSPDFNTVFGNLPKLLLSLESLFFCSILLFQHYVLYRHNNKDVSVDDDDDDDDGGGDVDRIARLNENSDDMGTDGVQTLSHTRSKKTNSGYDETDDGSESPLLDGRERSSTAGHNQMMGHDYDLNTTSASSSHRNARFPPSESLSLNITSVNTPAPRT